MAADTRKNSASRQSDLHGAAALFFLQLFVLLPFFTNWQFWNVDSDACTFRQHSYSNFLGLGLSGAWLIVTASFERTNLYRKHRNSCLCIVYSMIAASDALQVCKSPHIAWRNSFLKCILPGLINPLAHQSSEAALFVRLAGHLLLFSLVVLSFGGLALTLTMIPILTSALVSGGLLATQLANHVDPETTRGDDLGDCSEKGTAISGARVRSAEKVDGPNSSQAVVEFPHVVSVLLADGEKVFGHQERDSVHSREIGLQNKIEDETWAQSLKAGPSTSKGGAERFTQGGSTMAGALRKEGTPLEDEWNVSAAFGGSGFGGRAKRRRGKKPVEEKVRL